MRTPQLYRQKRMMDSYTHLIEKVINVDDRVCGLTKREHEGVWLLHTSSLLQLSCTPTTFSHVLPDLNKLIMWVPRAV